MKVFIFNKDNPFQLKNIVMIHFSIVPGLFRQVLFPNPVSCMISFVEHNCCMLVCYRFLLDYCCNHIVIVDIVDNIVVYIGESPSWSTNQIIIGTWQNWTFRNHWTFRNQWSNEFIKNVDKYWHYKKW